MRCSASSTRAASVSGVSPASTGTAACATIGPESISADTKCTVAPCVFTPASSARSWVSRPLNAGSRAGWMLSMRPCHWPTNHGVSRRMKPARQTSSMRCAVEHVLQARARRRRGPCRSGVWSTTAVAMPWLRARDRARRRRAGWRRPARSRPDSPSSFAASISAAMLEPRPEIRMATRLLRPSRSPARSRLARIGDARRARCRRRDLAEPHDRLAVAREHGGDRVGAARRRRPRPCRSRN